ncbi:MAG TPA: class I SAM-dependent methyltransferase, partial [Thermoprotei archaeon]|nr:class I SAM-dependent methyltransferase [Thermoprotei archaeon]
MDIDRYEDISKLYDESVDAYDRLYRDIQRRKYLLICNMYNPQNILDLGIGTGYICEVTNSYIIGIDISYKSLLKARIRCGYADLILTSIEDPPIRGGFDLVLMISTIHHLKNPFLTVENISRLGSNIAISVMKRFESSTKIREYLLKHGYRELDLWDDKLY